MPQINVHGRPSTTLERLGELAGGEKYKGFQKVLGMRSSEQQRVAADQERADRAASTAAEARMREEQRKATAMAREEKRTADIRSREERQAWAAYERDKKATDARIEREEKRSWEAREKEQKKALAIQERERKAAERTALRDQRENQRNVLRQQRQAEREALQQQRQAERAATQQQREAAREKAMEARAHSVFWRDTVIGGAVGLLGGGASIPAIAGGIGGLIGGVGAGMAGASPTTTGAIAEIGKVIAELIADPTSSARSASQRAINFQQQSFAIGRAGGFPGGALTGALHPNRQTPSAWQQALGVSPMDALQSLSTFGIAPRSGAGANDLARTLLGAGQSPAFAGLAKGTVEGLAGQGVAMGSAAATGAGVQGYTANFWRLMEEANVRGLDRSRLLSNIESSIEGMARAGAASVSPAGVADLFGRFAGTGTPGGRTGTTAANLIAGGAAQFGNAFQNPMLLTMMFSQMQKFGGFKTAGDVRQFLGANANTKQDSYTEFVIGQINKDVANGMRAQAAAKASTLLVGRPARALQLTEQFAPSVRGGMSGLDAFLLRGIFGVDLGTALQAQFASTAQGAGTGPGTGDTKKFMDDLRAGKTPQGLPLGANALLSTDEQVQLANSIATLEKIGPAAVQAAEGLTKLENAISNLNKAVGPDKDMGGAPLRGSAPPGFMPIPGL